MVGISSDTKQAFGRMLVFLKTSQTVDHTIYPFLTYADTLIVWTEAGLKLLGKYDKYKKEIEKAVKLYEAAIYTLRHTDISRAGWQHEQIIRLTFQINRLIFPIAMIEGILTLNQDMINVSGLLLGSPEIQTGQQTGQQR